MPDDAITAPPANTPQAADLAGRFAMTALGEAQPGADPPADPAAAPAPTPVPDSPAADPAAVDPEPTTDPPTVADPPATTEPAVTAEPDSTDPASPADPAAAPVAEPATEDAPTVELTWGDDIGQDPPAIADPVADEELTGEATGLIQALGDALDGDRPEKARQLLLSTSRGREMLRRNKVLRDLENTTGVQQTPEQLEEMRGAAADFNSLIADLSSGNAEQIGRVADELLGTSAAPLEWAPVFVDQLIDRAQNNPQLSGRLRKAVVAPVVEEVLNQAANATTANERKYLAQVANGLHRHMNAGAEHPDFKAILEGGARTAPTPGTPATETEEVRQLRAQVAEQRQQDMRSRQGSLGAALASDVNLASSQHLDHAINTLSIPDNVKTGAVFAGVRSQFEERIRSAVRSDPTFKTIYQQRHQDVLAGDAAAQQHIQRAHRSAVAQHTQKLWPTFFAELKATFAPRPAIADPKAELDARNAHGAQPPASGTQNVSIPARPEAARQNGRPSVRDFRERLSAQALQGMNQ